MKGRRVDNTEAVLDGKPGDYYPVLTDSGEVAVLWFRSPTGSIGRIVPKGHGKPEELKWDSIVVEPDGTVTVEPSIEQQSIPGNPPTPYWHGYLRKGVWEPA